LIDQSFTNPAAILHLPDVRLTDIKTRVVSGRDAQRVDIDERDRAMLFYALKGDFIFTLGSVTHTAPEGTAVGFQVGLKHCWKASDNDCELFISSIYRQAGPLQGLDEELIIVPPNADPSAHIIRHAVAIHKTEYETRSNAGDDMIIRRCAEIVMAELVRFAQTSLVETGEFPHGIAHDEHLLRAWSAYYAAPRDRWTVLSLAKAAGLGRTAFSERFRKAMGVPPLSAITDLRLQQAEVLLREGKTALIEIAFTVGYNSEAAFVRAFHRKFGMPPGKYRHMQKL
jgi:AraC-like DNA-binding protein